MCIYKGHRGKDYVCVWLLGVRVGPSISYIRPIYCIGGPDGVREREKKIKDNPTERAAVAGATPTDRAAVAGARTDPPAEVCMCVCVCLPAALCVSVSLVCVFV
jgi:hypothetical protein